MNYKKNSDGSDMLDEQGNPIPEENTNPNGDETITSEEAKKLKDALTNTVEELKELRKKNKELSEKIAPVTPPEKIDDESTKIVEVVKKVLKEEKMSSVKTDKQVALEKFIAEHKEFHPDNDASGLKREALEKKLNRFNTDDIIDVNEYYEVIEEAYTLLGKNDNNQNTSKEIKNPYSSTVISRMTPKKTEVNELTPKEQKLVDRGATTKEYILKLREKNPSYLASLLQRVSD